MLSAFILLALLIYESVEVCNYSKPKLRSSLHSDNCSLSIILFMDDRASFQNLDNPAFSLSQMVMLNQLVMFYLILLFITHSIFFWMKSSFVYFVQLACC